MLFLYCMSQETCAQRETSFREQQIGLGQSAENCLLFSRLVSICETSRRKRMKPCANRRRVKKLFIIFCSCHVENSVEYRLFTAAQ